VLWLGVRRQRAFCVALNLLELFVAFLQAYVFTFFVRVVYRHGGSPALTRAAARRTL